MGFHRAKLIVAELVHKCIDSERRIRRLLFVDTRRLQSSSSSSSLSIGAIVGIVVGVLVLVVIACICIRRARLESRRKQMQKRVDLAFNEGAQQQKLGLQETLLVPTARLSQAPHGEVPTPIEHVVGSTDSDDFVIMGGGKATGAAGAPDFAKMNKVGMNMKTNVKPPLPPSKLGVLEDIHSAASGDFVASYVSDDIAILQSARGGSFDMENPKWKNV
ncbi:hypothetical protein AC1031_009640 [Aphanomyces cochlioides]|nr:hypothetical protein AC1031_009640 [Aphanomyces cochlioides]